MSTGESLNRHRGEPQEKRVPLGARLVLARTWLKGVAQAELELPVGAVGAAFGLALAERPGRIGWCPGCQALGDSRG